MIAVIADDFTGAAEVGGVALRHGLKVVIETSVAKAEEADVLIVATNTRSMCAAAAAAEVEKVTRQLLEMNPKYIFKKLDSVLRGNIVRELEAQMHTMSLEKAVVVAGNPYFGRLIKNGVYYVDGVPLGETYFAHDPDFPVYSSVVKEILNCNEVNPSVEMVKLDDVLPNKGMLFGDVASPIELHKWVKQLDEKTMPAGGAGFFDALLEYEFPKLKLTKVDNYKLGDKTLFIFGSAFPKSDELLDKFAKAGLVFENMPREIYINPNFSEKEMQRWAKSIITKLEANVNVIVAIDYADSTEENISLRLQQNMAQVIYMVMSEVSPDDLLIEGGATASEILRGLSINTMYPFQELDAGVIQMRTKGYKNLCITTKPGSYPWPENLLFNQ